MKLFEVLNTVVEWEWRSPPQLNRRSLAVFELDDGTRYELATFPVDHVGEDGEEYHMSEIAFVMVDDHNDNHETITHSGSPLEVFSTVVDIVNDFIKKCNPQGISFSADRDEPSRVRLYKRFTRMLTSRGWKQVELESGRYNDLFGLIREQS